MARMFGVCVLCLSLPLVGRADEPPKTETVYRLTVTPRAAPKPALRYQLLPELQELNPGNPIQGYMKCFMEQNHFYHNKEVVENREKWQKVPLKELPLEELRGYGGSGLRQADYAARLETPDWQILPKLKTEGIHLLMPEIQQLRMLAAALKVRLRGEIADRRFDDAIRTIKTQFAMSRHLAEHPTLIAELVGMAIVALTLEPVAELIEQPGSPNLYWALTNLPEPMIPIHRGLQCERYVWLDHIPQLEQTEPLTDEQLDRVIDKVRETLKYIDPPGGPRQDLRDWLKTRAKDADYVKLMRKRLVEYGLPEGSVNKMPPLQLVLLDEKREYEVRRDEVLKWLTRPYWQAEAALLDRKEMVKEGEQLLFGGLFPAALKVRRAQARVDQRIALLRCVEAVRLYAADNNGKVPAKLTDLKVPVPIDPFTGKPFVYKADGQTVTIQATPPRGEEKNAAYNVRYEVTVTK